MISLLPHHLHLPHPLHHIQYDYHYCLDLDLDLHFHHQQDLQYHNHHLHHSHHTHPLNLFLQSSVQLMLRTCGRSERIDHLQMMNLDLSGQLICLMSLDCSRDLHTVVD